MTQEEREDLVVAMMPFAGLLNMFDGDGFGRTAAESSRSRIEQGLLDAGLSVENVRGLYRAVMTVLAGGA